MSTPEHVRKAMAIFDEVCDLPAAQRHEVVQERCAGDETLRQRVEQMLASEHDTHAVFGNADQGQGAQMVSREMHAYVAAVMPDRIERYQVIRELGRGGMGIVYEAEQDSPKRRVALKMIQTAGMSENLIRRFEREAFVLGQLQHPGIAHIYESGTTRVDGMQRPYLAMELIEGERITTFAENNKLSVAARLELMARVCDAVQHAHQKGVIHRDLKPANILVVEQTTSHDTTSNLDGIGQPKVLDFGVARLTDSDRQAVTLQTDVGQIVGTLAYMSPEQVIGDPSGIDTRCDVYALGVVLFQLLTDRLPLDVTGKPIGEAARIIRDEEPTTVSEWDHNLRGDIETVIAKALEKDVERRYASAAEFASDLRRFLRDEPIAARPASAMYQLRKFTRRNPAIVGGAAATFAALALGLAATGYALVEARDQFARAERERDKAVTARKDADRQHKRQLYIANFFAELLEDLEANEFGDTLIDELLAELKSLDRSGVDTTRAVLRDTFTGVHSTNVARNVMRKALAERAIQKMEDKPQSSESEARIRYSVARMYTNLGMLPEAAEQAEIALKIEREHLGNEHQWTLQSMNFLASIYRSMGRMIEAEALYRESLAIRREALGEEHPDTIDSLGRLASLFERKGELKEAEELLKRVLKASESLDEEHQHKTLTQRNTYGVLLLKQHRYEEAAACFQDILRTREQTLGLDAGLTILTRNNLMSALFKLGDFAQALPIARSVLESSRRVHGDAHLKTTTARNNLGVVLLNVHAYDQAEAVLRESHRHAVGLAPESVVRMSAISNLVDALLAQQEWVEAEPHCRTLIETRRNLRPPQPGLVAQTLEQLGHALFGQERFADARDAWQECVDLRAGIASDHWLTNRARSELGAALGALQQFEEAETLLLQSYEALLAQEDAIPIVAGATCLRDARQRIATLYEAWGKPEQARSWR